MAQITPQTKITRVVNATAAGITNVNGTAVDMAGYDGVRFIVALGAGAASSVGQVKAQDSDTLGGAYNDIAGSAGTVFTPTTDDNKVWVLDIYRPTHRFVRPVVIRATGNTTIDSVVAEQYASRNLPQSNDATTVLGSKQLVSPVDGTA